MNMLNKYFLKFKIKDIENHILKFMHKKIKFLSSEFFMVINIIFIFKTIKIV